MADICKDYKLWLSMLQRLDLDDIVLNLKNLKNTKQDADSDKFLFKFLLHLSHCADRCYREKLSKEIQLFAIVNSICENLSTVPDKNKLFSAIYYIVYYLLNQKHFKEAEIVSSYLLPGKILLPDDHFDSAKYYQIASLWQIELLKELDSLITDQKTNEEISEEICRYVNFHFQLLKFCDESLCYTFKTVDIYVRKLASFTLTAAHPCLFKIFVHVSNYILSLKKLPVIEAYNRVIGMIGFTFYKRNDVKSNSNVLNFYRQLDSYFLEALKNTHQCYNCYKLFREYSINIFETDFMSNDIGESRFKKSCDILEILLQKYGSKDNSVIETVTAITYSFETLFLNWGNLVSKQLANTNVTYNDILRMGSFVKKVHNILEKRPFPPNHVCKTCPESVPCSMKYDVYNASVATSMYIRVITKFNLDALEEKIIRITIELIGKLLSSFKELNRNGCVYSNQMWNICGRTIFNIGLISENKYPAHVESLYEELCSQIVRRDGLNEKYSSFGLENPVGTALHRLNNANFNQGKYRKAMTYTAYNALLSTNENGKKKAYDVWANIKFKHLDSNEIQELTLLKCIEIDKEEVSKFGIDIDLKNYDVSDICFRELKSLFEVKGNVILSMKKTLAEIESTKNSLHFAQGVLLLCFHAQQLSEREFISDYIAKAISKLKNHRPVTPGSQCLLADLNFFAIIEKIYVRSRAVNKQIKDAKFTVKAFKLLRGNCLDDDMEEDIVPTYGGINIEEDNKCANELRDVIHVWEKYFTKSITAFTKDWDLKFTLEIILICGEYCRLYKFNNLEERSWKLAHKLATALKDQISCIYVTSRSISLRYINDEWINDAEKYVENIRNSSKNVEMDVVVLFWLSLADFYFDCKKVTDAKVLLNKAKSMSNYEFLKNSKLYMYATDIQFRNCYLIKKNTSQEEYCQLLVESHYSLIHLHEIILQGVCRFWSIKYQLFAFEQMFETMFHVMIPMIKLLSYREASLHLAYGLNLAQSYGMTLRIAEFLKYFCYIDLLRTHVEDCEARLQDLEHILCLEQFQKSMKYKLQGKFSEPILTKQKVRDAAVVSPINFSKNCASPELKKKLFSLPNFLDHAELCHCFICTNLHYQYLTFSCTHIRAQLYSLLKYKNEAMQHFHGAFKIKMKIEAKDTKEIRQYKDFEWKRHLNFTIDSLQCMLDFSLFVIEFMPEQKGEALTLIEEVLVIADENDLSKHYINSYANELYFQYHIYDVFQNQFSISVPVDIPINITNQPTDNCTTPKQHTEKVAGNPRRRKSPTAVPIPVIKIEGTSSDEENNCGNSPVPKDAAAASKDKKPVKRTSARNVRRKILVDDVEESPSGSLKEEPTSAVRRSTRLSKK